MSKPDHRGCLRSGVLSSLDSPSRAFVAGCSTRRGCEVFVEHVFNVLENRLIGHVENVPHVIYSQPRRVTRWATRIASQSPRQTPIELARGRQQEMPFCTLFLALRDDGFGKTQKKSSRVAGCDVTFFVKMGSLGRHVVSNRNNQHNRNPPSSRLRITRRVVRL